MRQFDFYEFAAILLPGVAALTGILLAYPTGIPVDVLKDFTVGDLGLFVLLAYLLGHLVQSVGNALESVWWKLFNGMPTDWVRREDNSLLSPSQSRLLEGLVRERLGLRDFVMGETNRKHWYSITRQVYADVAAAGRTNRVDTFNGNYGLNRGIAAGFLVFLVAALSRPPIDWWVAAGAAIALALAIARMHRFGRHYARELFVQFLQLPPKGTSKDTGNA
jgi:hypothetical protein